MGSFLGENSIFPLPSRSSKAFETEHARETPCISYDVNLSYFAHTNKSQCLRELHPSINISSFNAIAASHTAYGMALIVALQHKVAVRFTRKSISETFFGIDQYRSKPTAVNRGSDLKRK